MDIRNYQEWNKTNGLLSVKLEPNIDSAQDSKLYVMLNGNTGNFCLDYIDGEEDFTEDLAFQRAWSADTGYYVRIIKKENDDKVEVLRWWDGYKEVIPGQKVIDNLGKFYTILTKEGTPRTRAIISFAKEAFIKLRNCVPRTDNGLESLRTFMYLLAALEGKDDNISNVNRDLWHLKEFDNNWINPDDWLRLYNDFKNGVKVNNGLKPLVNLVLRHASNRLFQEAHREATRKIFQMSMFGEANRKYDSGISDGAYYTPTALVRTIVQEALWALDKVKPIKSRPNLRILDPACGSAEFLRKTLRQLKILGYKGRVHLEGWDISPIAIEVATFVLYYEKRMEWEANPVDINIIENNSLASNWSETNKFDIVLMNPPFISFENLGNNKDFVITVLKDLVKGQPDAAAVFWKKAAECVAEDGVMGVILPHSFLSADTYSKLRTYIKDGLGFEFSLLSRLGSSGLFEKAMIIPSVTIAVKKEKPIANTVLWTDFQQKSVFDALRELRIYRFNEMSVPKVTSGYSIYENELLTKIDNKLKTNNWNVNSHNAFLLSEKLKNFDIVGKIFNITKGVDTGNNAAFIIETNKVNDLPKKEQQYFRPIIMKDSFVKGQLNKRFSSFYPYDKSKIGSENELKEKLPTYYKSLEKHKDKLKKRKGFEINWWELNRERSIPEIPKIVSVRFGKAGYFAFDQNGEYLVGQSYAWLPKIEISKKVANEQFCYAYLAILHAPILDKLLETVCNVLDGGYFDLSKHYVDNLPLPDISKVDGSLVQELSTIGAKIHAGIQHDKMYLNELVANTYGLNLDLFN